MFSARMLSESVFIFSPSAFKANNCSEIDSATSYIRRVLADVNRGFEQGCGDRFQFCNLIFDAIMPTIILLHRSLLLADDNV